jgi:hypothetical protein
MYQQKAKLRKFFPVLQESPFAVDKQTLEKIDKALNKL